ncbi:MAG: hypothetical protein ACP5D7_18400 [Limnospira sp.]
MNRIPEIILTADICGGTAIAVVSAPPEWMEVRRVPPSDIL